ncbi:hypothetical protein JCM4914_38150 [Streptomyces platensis subsp. malvinus]
MHTAQGGGEVAGGTDEFVGERGQWLTSGMSGVVLIARHIPHSSTADMHARGALPLPCDGSAPRYTIRIGSGPAGDVSRETGPERSVAFHVKRAVQQPRRFT